MLSCVLFTLTLGRADEPILLTAVLPHGSAVLAPLHPGGLGEDERALG